MKKMAVNCGCWHDASRWNKAQWEVHRLEIPQHCSAPLQKFLVHPPNVSPESEKQTWKPEMWGRTWNEASSLHFRKMKKTTTAVRVGVVVCLCGLKRRSRGHLTVACTCGSERVVPSTLNIWNGCHAYRTAGVNSGDRIIDLEGLSLDNGVWLYFSQSELEVECLSH